MARYTGPKTKKSRAFGQPIYGYDKYYERRKYPPGHHGGGRRRRQKSDYALQLMEKQKAKYTYGVLERQFRNLFHAAESARGVTGEILIQFLESRLDNTVFRMGIAPTRRAARQLVTHKHIVLNGVLTNIPSVILRPGDVVAVRGKSQSMEVINESVNSKSDVRKFPWLEFNKDKMEGTFVSVPERENIPETINEQLIVELYSK
ncbi:30S ribosomal protein S4 [Membranicola marinus]|uniref:Small ribosomal subunit protein uS4 n=1 Tax=Membranihabitans marinus TaxID=1227546 RepID=A0A953HZ28_9BACT|nr:30S ribosomal protein S4 [Membranihabitans marinus]MBY5959326.1 30S ribosomal protein S4 [Membranihabitans marinus]